MSHTQWYRDGEISKQEYDNLEYLKRHFPNLYKAREKYIWYAIKQRRKIRKMIRKHKAIPLGMTK